MFLRFKSFKEIRKKKKRKKEGNYKETEVLIEKKLRTKKYFSKSVKRLNSLDFIKNV